MKRFIGFAAALALGAPLLASAAQGWVVADISLQAGPDTAYPSLVELRAGTPVSIHGCIDGWTWCDVSVGDDAGWVPGTFLEEDYGGQRVVVVDYGPRIGIPVVAFSLGVYWDRHYHNRPFYAQRQEWTARSITPHAPPRPTGVAVSGASHDDTRSTADAATHDGNNAGSQQHADGANAARSVPASPGTRPSHRFGKHEPAPGETRARASASSAARTQGGGPVRRGTAGQAACRTAEGRAGTAHRDAATTQGRATAA